MKFTMGGRYGQREFGLAWAFQRSHRLLGFLLPMRWLLAVVSFVAKETDARRADEMQSMEFMAKHGHLFETPNANRKIALLESQLARARVVMRDAKNWLDAEKEGR